MERILGPKRYAKVDDKEIVEYMVQIDPETFIHASYRLCVDEEFVLYLLNPRPENKNLKLPDARAGIELPIELIYMLFKNISILEAVLKQKRVEPFKITPPMDSDTIVKFCVKNGYACKYTPYDLYNITDKPLLLDIIGIDWENFGSVNTNLLYDHDFLMDIIKRYGDAPFRKCVNKTDLIEDGDVMLELLKISKYNLCLVNSTLLNSNWFIPSVLNENIELVIELLSLSDLKEHVMDILESIDKNWKNRLYGITMKTLDSFIPIMKTFPYIITYLNGSLSYDETTILKLLNMGIKVDFTITDKYTNKDIIFAVAKTFGELTLKTERSLRVMEDAMFVGKIVSIPNVKINIGDWRAIPNDVESLEYFYLKLVMINEEAYYILPIKVKQDFAISMNFVRTFPRHFKNLSLDLKSDKQFVLSLLSSTIDPKNRRAIQFSLPITLDEDEDIKRAVETENVLTTFNKILKFDKVLTINFNFK
jgi:hypothetical protein